MVRLNYLFNYPELYIEKLGKLLSGKDNENPIKNGEYKLIKSISKIASKQEKDLVFFDGGANIGGHTNQILKNINLLKNSNFKVYAFEPFHNTYQKLIENVKSDKCFLIMKALSDKKEEKTFYYDDFKLSGRNSCVPHSYLNNKSIVDSTTIDIFCEEEGIKSIYFLKLDIEGHEIKALNGARNMLSKKNITYIQLEYNLCWKESNSSIKEIMDICKEYDFDLYRICPDHLRKFTKYHPIVDDYVYSNLLMVQKNKPIPMRCKKDAFPLTFYLSSDSITE